MKILAVKSVPLSKDTIDSWKSVDGLQVTDFESVEFRFMKRDRHENESVGMAIRNRYDMVLNLGNSKLTEQSEYVWNDGELLSILLTPGAMRRSPLAACLPPLAVDGKPYWVKGPGRAGVNKEKHADGKPPHRVKEGWDVQQHVDGEEWRVLTVGYRLVQANKRFGPNGERVYEWAGTQNTPQPVKNICRYAASLLPNRRAVVAWDVIHNKQGVFIFEGNTSPGVNEDTASRIVRELHRQVVMGDYRDTLLDGAKKMGKRLTTTEANTLGRYRVENVPTPGYIAARDEDPWAVRVPNHPPRITVRDTAANIGPVLTEETIREMFARTEIADGPTFQAIQAAMTAREARQQVEQQAREDANNAILRFTTNITNNA